MKTMSFCEGSALLIFFSKTVIKKTLNKAPTPAQRSPSLPTVAEPALLTQKHLPTVHVDTDCNQHLAPRGGSGSADQTR
jgi:hypothetical protein